MKRSDRNIQTMFLLFIVILLTSCKREMPKCTGNCVDVRFAGTVFNKATNTPMSGQVVNVYMNKSGFCLFCPLRKIGSVKTESDGSFSLMSTIDSTLLNENHLVVSMKKPNGYISYPEPVGPGILPNTPEYLSVDFYDLDPSRMEHISFGFYPRTLLKINLHRTTPVSPDKYLSLEFKLDEQTSVWGLRESNSNADTTLTIYTSASMFTKIISRKSVTNIDSVYCRTNQDNSINISY